MTQGASSSDTGRSSPGARRFGYAVGIAVNAGLLYVVTHLLEWDLLGFLTDDFEAVVPIIAFSLLASIVVNLAYLWYDDAWFKTLAQLILNLISLAATVRLFRVFPFDFSSYDLNVELGFMDVTWEAVARAVLVLAMVGLGIAIISEGVKLIAIVRDRASAQ